MVLGTPDRSSVKRLLVFPLAVHPEPVGRMLRDVCLRGARVALDNVGSFTAVRRLSQQLQRSLVIAAPRPRDANEENRRAQYSRNLIGADKERGVLIHEPRPVLLLLARRRLIS